MYNENNSAKITTETDSSGGNRKIEEESNKKEVIFTETKDGSSAPMTQTIVSPKIEGVIVTAEGASNVSIKSNIIAAVEAVTGVPAHKIQVFTSQ